MYYIYTDNTEVGALLLVALCVPSVREKNEGS